MNYTMAQVPNEKSKHPVYAIRISPELRRKIERLQELGCRVSKCAKAALEKMVDEALAET